MIRWKTRPFLRISQDLIFQFIFLFSDSNLSQADLLSHNPTYSDSVTVSGFTNNILSFYEIAKCLSSWRKYFAVICLFWENKWLLHSNTFENTSLRKVCGCFQNFSWRFQIKSNSNNSPTFRTEIFESRLNLLSSSISVVKSFY